MITTPQSQTESESPLGSDSCSGSLPESNLGCQHLKTWPKYFDAVERGTKTFEIRQNDRPFMIGQRLVLHEYDPEEDKFTGRTVERRITYMTDWEQKPGFVVLAIKPICQNDQREGLATEADLPRFVSGIRVQCIDDSGWIIPDPGYQHLSPEKGKIYTVREYAKMGGVGAISLMEGHEDNFYRACRFRPVSR